MYKYKSKIDVEYHTKKENTKKKIGKVVLQIESLKPYGNNGVEGFIIFGSWKDVNGSMIRPLNQRNSKYSRAKVDLLESNLPELSDPKSVSKAIEERTKQMILAVIDTEYQADSSANFGLNSSNLELI